MLIFSAASLCGIYYMQYRQLLEPLFAKIFAIIVALVLVLGIVVSVIGCDRCVAKLLGKAET